MTEFGHGVAPTGQGRGRTGQGIGLGLVWVLGEGLREHLHPGVSSSSGRGLARGWSLPRKRKQPKEQQSLVRRGFIRWSSLFAAQTCGGTGRQRTGM